ncbi:MAG: response regulator transcription factor [Treponema sp.]|jgi:DNA-binding NarL/FixJ family response regulator|nr:response regulator transcription factor [Treponema sp.]
MIRVMVVSGHADERSRLNSILNQWPEFDISGMGRDAYDALNFAHSFKPDVALVDENPPILDCSGMVLALKRWSPNTKVIVLADSCDNQAVLKSIVNGAAGYLLKDRDAEIVPGINWVYRGGTLMGSEVVSRAFENSSGEQGHQNQKQRVKITRKELELMTRVGKGLSNKEIAAELRLKDGTIRNYISGLLQKTGLRNRTEIALYVYRSGIIGNEQKISKKTLV